MRLSQKTGAGKLEARFMDGDMRLTQASAGFVDTIGRARIDRGGFPEKMRMLKAMDAWLGAQQGVFCTLVERQSRPVRRPVPRPLRLSHPRSRQRASRKKHDKMNSQRRAMRRSVYD